MIQIGGVGCSSGLGTVSSLSAWDLPVTGVALFLTETTDGLDLITPFLLLTACETSIPRSGSMM